MAQKFEQKAQIFVQNLACNFVEIFVKSLEGGVAQNLQKKIAEEFVEDFY